MAKNNDKDHREAHTPAQTPAARARDAQPKDDEGEGEDGDEGRRSIDDPAPTFGTPGAPAASKSGVPLPPNLPKDASLEAIAAQPAGAPGGVMPARGAGAADTASIDYRPERKVHLADAGPVALSNWVGRVNGQRVSVYRGAQANKIPPEVQKAMTESGVEIGTVTHGDLGLRTSPATTTLR